MKYSKQRELTLNTVINNRIHPTAEEIYLILKNEQPNISLGTVYRNLNILAETGLIRKINIPNAKDRFDATLSEHYHVICEKCSKVFDVDMPLKEEVRTEVLKQTGVNVTKHELVINGICKNCNKNRNGD